MFPYPDVLDAEQRENLEILLPMAEKVIVEVNDPLLNDKLGEVPEETTRQLKELGAFGMQVRTSHMKYRSPGEGTFKDVEEM